MVKYLFFFSLLTTLLSCSLSEPVVSETAELYVPAGELTGTVLLKSGDSCLVICGGEDSASLQKWLNLHGSPKVVPIQSGVFGGGVVERYAENESAELIVYRHGQAVLAAAVPRSGKPAERSGFSSLTPTLMVVSGKSVPHISADLIYRCSPKEILTAGSIFEDSAGMITDFCADRSIPIQFPVYQELCRNSRGDRWR